MIRCVRVRDFRWLDRREFDRTAAMPELSNSEESMCGILGIVSLPGETAGIELPQLIAMRDTMQPRGPDDAGLFERRNVALAHRRLAIRDLARGKQPWISDDEQCVLVYNGEVYNDEELRRELASAGRRFHTRCDTEVVMAAYQQWGRDCVHRFRGMFAFGLYDFRDDSLLLVRDRFGIKPLFFTQIDGRLLFASSIAALLKHPRMTKQPYLPALSHYLTTFRLTLGRDTMFAGIWQLLPGEMLTWNAGHVRIEQYWDYSNRQEASLSYEQAVAELHSELSDSVNVRLASDVPVGMFLSGGLDSNTIACLLRENTSNRTIARCGGGAAHDSCDFENARRIAGHVKFDYDETRLDSDEYFACWETMLDQYATPVSTPTDVILYRMSQQMKQSVGVVLGGEGADELLCGYAVTHWSGRDYEMSRRLDAAHCLLEPAAARIFRQSLKRQYGRDRFDSEVDHFFALNSLIPTAVKAALLQPWAWNEANEDRRMWRHYGAVFDSYRDRSVLDRYAAVLHRVNLEGQLARLDSATMLAGLEARVPYTDHLLVERMFRVPVRFKIDVDRENAAAYLASGDLEQRGSLHSKRILRSVAERLMPQSLSSRKKSSFPTPIASWMTGPWKRQIRDILQGSPFARSLFVPQSLNEVCENPPHGGMWLWPLLNVAVWGDRHFAA